MQFNFGRKYSSVAIGDEDFVLPIEGLPVPSESMIAGYVEPVVKEDGNIMVMAYLVDDHDCGNPIEDNDGEGRIYTAHRHAGREQHRGMQQALALDSEWSKDLELDAVVNLAETRLREKVLAKYPVEVVQWMLEAANQGMSQDRAWHELLENIKMGYHSDIEVADCVLDDPSFPSWDDLRAAIWHDLRNDGKIGDPYAVALDCYEHGMQHWSISGQGMQCQWDTAHGAGVWVPDDCAREEADRRAGVYAFGKVTNLGMTRGEGRKWLAVSDDGTVNARFEAWHEAFAAIEQHAKTLGQATDEQKKLGRTRAAQELAGEALEQYNAWLSGDCYGICVAVMERSGGGIKLIDSDTVWGYVGSDHAKDAMQDLIEEQLSAMQRKTA